MIFCVTARAYCHHTRVKDPGAVVYEYSSEVRLLPLVHKLRYSLDQPMWGANKDV